MTRQVSERKRTLLCSTDVTQTMLRRAMPVPTQLHDARNGLKDPTAPIWYLAAVRSPLPPQWIKR